MDAKRWTSLATFAAGCLSGAVIIGWRLGEGPVQEAVPLQVAHVESALARARIRSAATSKSDPSAGEVRELGPQALASLPGHDDAGEARNSVSEPLAEGKSVADVLAHLEAEYRRQETPKQSSNEKPSAEPTHPTLTAPTPPARDVPPVSSAVPPGAPIAPASLPSAKDASAPAVAPASAPAVAPASAPAVAPASSAEPVAVSANEQAVLPLSAEEIKALVASAGEQRLTAELRNVAALQQATIVQQAALAQQVAVLQYLQLVSATTNPKLVVPAHIPRRGSSGRIVDTLPSTFSASDNPWGFTYPDPLWMH